MCTNVQYVSRRVYGKGTSRERYTRWKFSGSIRRFFGKNWKESPDVTMPECAVLDRLIREGCVLPVPCCSCLECRILAKKHMALRLHHESRFWKEASFVTLTYNSESLPKDGSVNADDPARFVKSLRSYICRRHGKCRKRKACRGFCPKIKTFGCAEYGPKLQRPHYHLVIFGFQFDDLSHPRSCSNHWSKKKWYTFRSKVCADLWKKGFVEIGNLEPAAAEYVCGYTVKKIRGERKDEHYGGKRPEGVVCRSQGLGARYVHQYRDFLLRNGMVSFRGSRLSLPRFYRKILREFDEKAYEAAIKRWTKDKQLSSLYKAISPLRAKARDKIKAAQTALESRSYESVS